MSTEPAPCVLLDPVPTVASELAGGGGLVSALASAYFRDVGADEIRCRPERDRLGAVESHVALAERRRPGRFAVRMVTPSSSDHGWSAAGRTVLEVVADDVPYLVDSVTAELMRLGHDVHAVVHPIVDVVRDDTGALVAVAPVEDGTSTPGRGATRESWMHVEIDRLAEPQIRVAVAGITRVLRDVRAVAEDANDLRRCAMDVAAGLRRTPPAGVAPDDAAEAAELLEWLVDGHFILLGYREYVADGEHGSLVGAGDSGVGVLRADVERRSAQPSVGDSRPSADGAILRLARSAARATVARATYLDEVGIALHDDHGGVVGERRFVGLLTSRARRESVTRIPVLRRKVAALIRRHGPHPESHAGRTLLDILEAYPRDELFHASVDELDAAVEVLVSAREGRRLRVVVRQDATGGYVSALVSLPRDRYTTSVRERISRILVEELGGTDVEFTVHVGEATTASVHFVVQVAPGGMADLDVAELEARLQATARSWRDDLAGAVVDAYGEGRAARLVRFLDAFPAAYREDFPATVAAADLGRLESLAPGDVDFTTYVSTDDQLRLKVLRVGDPLLLSSALPMLASLGVEVTDERPYELLGLPDRTFIYDFGLQYAGPQPDLAAQALLRDALRELWRGRSEVDGFNALVLRAGLDHRQVMVLRAYAKYLRQAGAAFSQETIEAALCANPAITALLVTLFEARFDPVDVDGRGRQEDLQATITAALEDVSSLDQDRILRSYLAHIRATLRTNHWQRDDGTPKPYLSLKLDPQVLPDLPQPRPAYEIFVYSPRVEGVHLRFGAVARGGLRWSDRRDDFRTEVLGLVKAQMVKNTVIVPVGAKGGFVPKRLPSPGGARPSGDRDAWFEEGKAAYVTFIRGLLDITDNLVEGGTVAPVDVVCHDGEDSYLVVAADKGTATFSDLANEVAKSYGFWLGDAFASGGSVGYDHKAMGITARGAWVSVQRHFREMGVDTQSRDFTVVGIGDMSGDVFGNGMLLSPHIRLVAAFDHRDVFLDPDPDAARSFAERTRLFGLPRSSWQDYDRSLISEGGGVWSRQLKAIPISEPVRAVLGLGPEVARLTPAELISAILKAPVDLLWNGGVGTYVKASHEPHSAAGDKANDAVRVDGRDLRAKAVGEGGNLGLTQAGRVEYALAGGRINTDAIDNSAGVDTSDHEVNLKILLDREVAAGRLAEAERGGLLGEMTDEVAALVLVDNEEQNLALANAAAHAGSLLHIHEEQMADLEQRGILDRAVEGLPSSAEVRRRLEAGGALTAPEHAVLMSWTKIELGRALAQTELPEDPYVSDRLRSYFPSAVQRRFSAGIADHPLRREIVVTALVNEVVNRAGTTFWPRLVSETGAAIDDLVRANLVARDVFGVDELLGRIKALGFTVGADVQTRMRIITRTLAERATRWLVAHRPGETAAAAERFAAPVARLLGAHADLLSGATREAYDARCARLVADGVPDALAARIAELPSAYVLLGVADAALREGRDPVDVDRAHVEVGERLGLSRLLAQIVALPRRDRWATTARAAVREDLNDLHVELAVKALRDPDWLESPEVASAATTLASVVADEPGDPVDLARVAVGVRVVRGLL